MADDIDELLDEVESKYIHSEGGLSGDQPDKTILVTKGNNDSVEEMDAAIDSICSIPEPVVVSENIGQDLHLNDEPSSRSCTVVYVGDSTASSGLSSAVNQRRTAPRKYKSTYPQKIYTKKYFTKPTFELSVKDLEAENARRKQKELVEKLFDQKLAVVTDKMILDVRKFKRIRSDVWTSFGDIRLLITPEEVKKLNIDHHVINIGDTEIIVCKSYVACVQCCSVFCYESHSYGTSTLRSHLKSCGRQMAQKRIYGKEVKKRRANLPVPAEIRMPLDPISAEKPVFQDNICRFRDQAKKLQEQVLSFFIKQTRPFTIMENTEFKDLLQTFVSMGSKMGNVDVKQYIQTPKYLSDSLVNTLYAQCDEAFQAEIQPLYGLSFSASIWFEVVEKISYITLTCHYANESGVFKSVHFHTSEFAYEQKTPDDVFKLFQDCLSMMHSDFKRLLVIDYSYNMVSAFNNGEQFVQCICYALNLAVQTVLNTLITTDEDTETEDDDPYAFACFVSLLTQCRNVAMHFKDNKLMSSLPRSLKLTTSNNWKSILEMMASVNMQWENIMDTLEDRNELDLFSIDQELLSIVVDFLEIFKDGYDELSSVTSPTLNLVLPWVTKWKTHCVLDESGESPFLAAVKTLASASIDNEIVKRITVHHRVAALLDPRYKNLPFLAFDDRVETKSAAESLVKECQETLIFNGIDVYNVAESDSSMDVCDENDEIRQCLPNEEVTCYLEEEFSMGRFDLDKENKFNPLLFWQRARCKYPYLSRVAMWLLSCPTSAIQTEDCFVQSDWMVTMRETEFPRKNMAKCLFVKSFKNFHQKL